ncbi:recombination-associated protein RdgC [Aquabacterium sp. A3]|uniref:recombination-associated protein RdgC n=1 Tax=Aquabacterium sp. A3 TaxID=3132829 RepID=UPI0031199BB2
MFKNLTVYRVGADSAPDLSAVEEALSRGRFVACGATQPKSMGWVEPRGEAHAPLVESIDGQWVMRLQTEQRVVPGAVVKRRVDEMAREIEQTTGRKPGKKLGKELKEQALLELLPRAFTKQSGTWVWWSPRERLLMLDTGSQARADEVVTLLIKQIDGLSLSLLHTEMSPAVAMAHWLGTGEAPQGFTVDRECELKAPDAMKSVVRYARHPLDIDEVRQHITAGKVPTRLSLTWRDRCSFTLTESMQLKKVALLDVVFESTGQQADAQGFDADVAIATGELIELIPDLVDALGGEQPMGLSAAEALPVKREASTPSLAGSPTQGHPTEDHAPPWDA